MSLSAERRSEQNNPDKFFTVLREGLSEEDFLALQNAGRELEKLDEPTGFSGLMKRHDIAFWNSLGYGKIVGTRIEKGNMLEKVDNDLNEYRGILYAFPFDDESVTGLDQRFVILLPSQNSVEMAIVDPVSSARLGEFEKKFAPSQEPYLHAGWNPPKPGQTPLEAFITQKETFFVDSIRKIDEREHMNMLDIVTKVAQQRINRK